jgi:hypothetical protein
VVIKDVCLSEREAMKTDEAEKSQTGKTKVRKRRWSQKDRK